MRSMRGPVCGALVFGAILSGAGPASAEWRRIDSPNFVVVGDVGERTLRDIAVRFEGFRETLSRVLTERVTSTPVPTVVVVFPSDKAYTPFKPRFNGKAVEIAGLFQAGRDVNYISLLADGNPEGFRVVFHEYAHLIVSNVTHQLPVWLNEGLAEYYSTYELAPNRRQAVIGRVVRPHLFLLNERTLLPLSTLVDTEHDSPLYNEGSRRNVFYAQSWALTHMLLQGKPDRTRQLGAYMTLTGRGTPARDAWTQAFGQDAVERAMQEYIRQRAFQAVQYSFSDKLATFDAAATKLPAADAEAFQAALLVQQGRFDEAAERTAKAAASGLSSPWLDTVSALVAVGKDQTEDARTRLLALDAGDDWLAAYFAGTALAEAQSGSSRVPASTIEGTRRHFAAARKTHPELPNAVVRLAALEANGEDVPSEETVAAIGRVRAQAPGRTDYVFVQAQVQARRGEFAAARSTLGPLISAAYPDDVRAHARRLMEYVLEAEAFDAQMRERAAARNSVVGAGGRSVVESRPETVATPPESRSDAKDAAARAQAEPVPGDALRLSDVRVLYRDREPGEMTVEGTLTNIECAAGGAATLHVRTPEGPVTLATPRMEDVDFITYRQDVTGTIGCGRIARPMAVRVTFRTASGSPATTVVVAVEFVPE
jgi:hypothetical protein